MIYINEISYYKKFFQYLTIFISLNILYLIFLTPNDSIIFYDIDSRRNIDEIIQILKPSNIYDFIYDASFGGVYTYGRIFHAIYALGTFVLIPVLISFLTIPQIIMLLNFNFLLLGLIFFCYKFISNIYFSFSLILLFLTYQISSVFTSETTSLEIFLFTSCLIILDESNLNKSKLIFFFTVGIITGIKFTNIIYFLLGMIFFKCTKWKNIINNSLSFLLGIFIAQPMVITPKGFIYFYENIYHHIFNYFEGKVTILNWFRLVLDNYGGFYNLTLIFIGICILSLKKVNLNSFFKIYFFGSFLQIMSFFFSDGVIRAHHIKLPIFFLFLITAYIIEKTSKQYIKIILLCNLLFFVFNVNNVVVNSNLINFYNFHTLKISSIYEKDLSIIRMREVENEIIKLSKEYHIKTIWWDQAANYFYPYSKFHWTSTENAETVDYFIKEMWGSQNKFLADNCAEFGGILVFIDKKIYIENELKSLQFNLYNYIDTGKGNGDFYFIYYKNETGLPLNC